MKEYVDMLLEGNHKKTIEEHLAFAKAARKRLKLGNEGIARRERMAKSIGRHSKRSLYLEDL
jgi:hypothetical protein